MEGKNRASWRFLLQFGSSDHLAVPFNYQFVNGILISPFPQLLPALQSSQNLDTGRFKISVSAPSCFLHGFNIFLTFSNPFP